MNWYLVDLLFAQPESKNEENVMCETCQVLFSAPSALVAYDKGTSWAAEHIEGREFKFVGVEYIQSVNEEPADGVEVGGRFYESEDMWQRKDELIPEKNDIRVIMWEQNSDVPIGEMITEQQLNAAKRIFGERDES